MINQSNKIVFITLSVVLSTVILGAFIYNLPNLNKNSNSQINPMLTAVPNSTLNTLNDSLTPKPSTIPFSLKQQCLDDANTIVNSRQQGDDKMWQIASKYHTGYTKETLKGSAYSPELNTCVAEIQTTNVQDDEVSEYNYIFDTTNNKLLAQCATTKDGRCDDASFIDGLSGYNRNPTWTDWDNFKNSIGL